MLAQAISNTLSGLTVSQLATHHFQKLPQKLSYALNSSFEGSSSRLRPISTSAQRLKPAASSFVFFLEPRPRFGGLFIFVDVDVAWKLTSEPLSWSCAFSRQNSVQITIIGMEHGCQLEQRWHEFWKYFLSCDEPVEAFVCIEELRSVAGSSV